MTARRFRLIRHHAVSGVSATGPVAEGVQFTDGAGALRWYGDYSTTTVWDSIESVIAIHGHQGATEPLSGAGLSRSTAGTPSTG